MHIHIFSPAPDRNRYQYQIVIFTDDGATDVHNADTSTEAEALATDLARRHGCDWRYFRDYPPLPHWFDEEGNFRKIDRMELIDFGNGRGQFNCFAGAVRLSTDMGTLSRLRQLMRTLLEDEVDDYE